MKIMKKLNFIFASIILFINIAGCGTVKEAFSTQKKDSTDEFLVEKKSPLKLPPNFDELPYPKSENIIEDKKEDNKIKKLITKTEQNLDKNNNSKNDTSGNSLENIVLEKIKIN